MKPVFFFAGGGVEQQPRRRPSTIAHTEAKSHRLASTRLGPRAQAVSGHIRRQTLAARK